MIEMNILDNGKGIKKGELNKVFDPLFTTKRNTDGSGLGLHIISNIVTNILNERINCNSELGVGSCFDLLFST